MTAPPVSLNMVQPSPTEERAELSTLIERLREAAKRPIDAKTVPEFMAARNSMSTVAMCKDWLALLDSLQRLQEGLSRERLAEWYERKGRFYFGKGTGEQWADALRSELLGEKP